MRFLIKLFPLFLIAIGVYTLHVYSPQIKNYVGGLMNFSTKAVIGSHAGPVATTSGQVVPPFPEKVKSDLSKSVETVKETGMNLKISDVASAAGRLGKVIKDAQNLGETVKKEITEFLKK